MRLTALCFLFLIHLACQAQNPSAQDLAKPVGIYNSEYQSYYGIYFLNKEATITAEMLRQKARTLYPHAQWVDSLSESSTRAEISWVYYENPKVDFTPPDMDYLRYTGIGLSQAEMQDLQDPEAGILLSFAGPAKQASADQWHILQLIDTLVANKDVIITDFVTYESFNPRSFKLARLMGYSQDEQDVSSQISIHLYREEAFCRAITLGMRKFALPDFSIEDLPCSNQYSYASLLNLICQTVFEQGTIGEDWSIYLDIDAIENAPLKKKEMLGNLEEGAKKKAWVKVELVDPQEGDDYNTQLGLVFDNSGGGSVQEVQNEVLSRLFGTKETLSYVEHDDEILEASQRAQGELPRLKKLFEEGLALGYSLLLKAPFLISEDEGNEWMWVEVSAWVGSQIKGILQNDPYYAPGLQAGSLVEVAQEDVFDYILYKPDGSYEGNETGKIMQKRN